MCVCVSYEEGTSQLHFRNQLNLDNTPDKDITFKKLQIKFIHAHCCKIHQNMLQYVK